jgi:hypothetical protein
MRSLHGRNGGRRTVRKTPPRQLIRRVECCHWLPRPQKPEVTALRRSWK